MIENEEATLSYFPKIKSHCVWTASTVRSLKALRVGTGKWKMMKNSSPPRETPQHLNIGFAYHQESFIFHPSKKINTAPKESLEIPRSCWRINFFTKTATLAVWAVNFSSFYQVLSKLFSVFFTFSENKKERRRRVKAWSFVLWYWEAYYQHVVSRLLGGWQRTRWDKQGEDDERRK